MNADQEAMDRVEDCKHNVRSNFDKAIKIMNDVANMSDNGEPMSYDKLKEKHQEVNSCIVDGFIAADGFSHNIRFMRENEDS